jgi:sugar lactone lactonase YvrE
MDRGRGLDVSVDVSTAEAVTGPVAHHGEGAFWDERGDRLLWVDMLEGTVLSRDAAGTVMRHPVPSPVACVVRRRAAGGFVVAGEHDLLFADDGLSRFETAVAGIVGDPRIRLNEGGVDPDGRFFIGSMAYDEASGAGALYRVDVDRSVQVVLPSVSISNGLQWSADGRRAFYIDTPTGRIDVVDVDPDSGAWSARRPHVVVDGTPGHPDGMAIDEDDGLWVALWGGSAVRHYDRHGVLRDEIAVPASQVTSCAFGGPDRRTLYITTSRLDLDDPAAEPQAGAVFAWESPVRGAALAAYAG